jgi:hypothetical protein
MIEDKPFWMQITKDMITGCVSMPQIGNKLNVPRTTSPQQS